MIKGIKKKLLFQFNNFVQFRTTSFVSLEDVRMFKKEE